MRITLWCSGGLWKPCRAHKHQSDHSHSEVLHFFSVAIKEHHQGDKDLVKDMSVNDMRR